MCFYLLLYCFFFFSSRRRHTRCSRDWSSDVCSSDLGRLRQAVSRLAEMLEQDPYDLPALLCLGRALLDDKRDAHALEAFRRVLKFDPDHVEALFQAGVALARLHRYGEAVQTWGSGERLDPAIGRAHV